MENAVTTVADYEHLDESKYCCYKNADDGKWYLWLPGCGLANLGGHAITEHEDGTITASPSVLTAGYFDGAKVQKHGFLNHGVWRDC